MLYMKYVVLYLDIEFAIGILAPFLFKIFFRLLQKWMNISVIIGKTGGLEVDVLVVSKNMNIKYLRNWSIRRCRIISRVMNLNRIIASHFRNSSLVISKM
eukprot:NODE_108_length_18904_cov_0.654826.p16 type:complete len:100 gc:universal NODE_108_length_18904_cov_0.654826:1287-988(-)